MEATCERVSVNLHSAHKWRWLGALQAFRRMHWRCCFREYRAA